MTSIEQESGPTGDILTLSGDKYMATGKALYCQASFMPSNISIWAAWSVCTILFVLGLFAYSVVVSAEESVNPERLFDISLEELMNTEVVTTTKTAQKNNVVPAKVRIITADEIKAKGYFTLEDALADLPGFQFRNIIGFNSYSFLRGIPSQNNLLLLLVDGIQINELNSGGFYGGGQFNLANVKKIEVVYGPASALYGTNAVSGIINIVTYDPTDMQGGRAGMLIGNFGTKNADFRYGFHDDKTGFGFSLSGMAKQTEKADLKGEKGDNNWSDSMENFEDDTSFDGKISYKDINAGLVYQDKRASRSTNYKSIGTDYLDFGTDWHIRFVNSYVKYTYKKSAKWLSHSQVYYRNATVVDDTIPFILTGDSAAVGQVGYYRPNNLIGFEQQIDVALRESAAMTVGFVLEEESLSDGFSETHSGSPLVKPSAPSKPAMTNNHLMSLYTQIQYRCFRNIELTMGIRHDGSSYYDTVDTPRIGVVYNRSKLTAKLLYGEAFRAPKPWDYTYGEGNADLDPEKMKSLEVNMSYALTDNCIADAALYKNTQKGILIKDNNRWVNGNEITTDGFETGLDYKRGKTRYFVNYTYNDSMYEYGGRVPEIGMNTANAGIHYSFTKAIALDIRGNYLGQRKNNKIIASTGHDEVDAAFITNCSLSFLNCNRFDFHVTIKNVTDERYFHTSDREPDRYRQPQRTITVRVEYPF